MNPLHHRPGPHLLVVGDLCPDIVVSGVATRGRELAFGQAEELVEATTLTMGGSAAITASAAAAAGAAVALVAVVGNDDLGRLCIGWLADREVGTDQVRVADDVRTGSSVVLVRADDSSDRHILTELGGIAALTADEVTDVRLASAGHVHVASWFLLDGARDGLPERLAAARTRGCTTSLDTNDDPAGAWTSAVAALPHCDVLFCNDREATGLAGTADPEAAVAKLLALMPHRDGDARFPAVVRKLGAEGARVVTARGTVSVEAPDVEVVDTVGAGDTLAGTVLAALVAGAEWPRALRLGVAAGSLSTTGSGGVQAQPDLRATQNLARDLEVSAHPRSEQENSP